MMRSYAAARRVPWIGLLAMMAGCSSSDHPPTLAFDSGFPADVATQPSDGGFADTTLPTGFTAGPHPELPQVLSQGGPTLTHMQLVAITYADDPNRPSEESLGQWIVSSDWLAAVGSEYGIGAGSYLGSVELTENAPTAITDNQIQTMIASGIQAGTMPSPPGGDLTQALYVIFFPSQTVITTPGANGALGHSCTDYGAYHNEDSMNGLDFAYAVVPACTYASQTDRTPVEEQEVSASHEVIEAALDPLPVHHAAYLLPTTDEEAWEVIGGELADLCSLPSEIIRDNGFALQRVWSNAAALAGNTDPCRPVPAGAYDYYAVTAATSDVLSTTAGSTVTVSLDAWSAGPIPAWDLSALAMGAFTPTFAFTRTSVNNGDSSTLTLNVPPEAPSGSYTLVYVYSAESMTNYHITPLVVLVQ